LATQLIIGITNIRKNSCSVDLLQKSIFSCRGEALALEFIGEIWVFICKRFALIEFIYSKKQGAEGFYAEGMHIDGSWFQYLARVLIGLATAK
jgi:hypothetical protein